jgi:hypothetical protein
VCAVVRRPPGPGGAGRAARVIRQAGPVGAQLAQRDRSDLAGKGQVVRQQRGDRLIKSQLPPGAVPQTALANKAPVNSFASEPISNWVELLTGAWVEVLATPNE